MDLFDEPQPGRNAPEFTVSELSGAVKRVIEGEFGRVRVRAEVGRVARPASGHVYLDLKDERAVLGSVIWKGTAQGLAVQPEEGMEVVATGRLTTFAGASKYQMVIEEIAPAGVGALMAMIEQRRTALAAEGLFAEARKRKLPFLPEVIGVVTSPSGAVIRDILHRLAERFPRPVLIWPVVVQGERCAGEVAAAIRGFNALAPGGPVPRPDVIIVARGGGSLEDLWGFNEEIVVRAAATSAIPLISAVGHETDTTLIDLAADRRAPTPTAAAEIAVPVRLDLMAALAGLEARRGQAQARDLAQRRQRLRDLGRGLPRAEALVGERMQRLDAAAMRLPRALRAAVQTRRLRLAQQGAGRFGPGLLMQGLGSRIQRCEALALRLPRALVGLAADRRLALARTGLDPRRLRDLVQRRREHLGQAARGLRPEGFAHRLGAARDRLETRAMRLARVRPGLTVPRRDLISALARTLSSLAPDRVLERGYVIVRGAAGKVVTGAAPAARAARLELQFADGRIDVRPAKAAPIRAKPPPAPKQGKLL